MIAREGLLPSRIRIWRGRAATALVVLLATAGTVQADVRVSGDVSAVQLDATQCTVSEALSALESAFRVRVNAPTMLDRAVSGTYTGALPEILSRLLRGYNYVVKRHAAEIEVTVFGSPGDRAAPQRPRLPPGNPAMSLADAARLKTH
jgi:hypothetical protein